MAPKKAVTPVKRGRGRPPNSATKPANTIAIPSKRGRGRPPNSATKPSRKPATTIAIPSKRGRGRPPKSSTTSKTTTATAASPAKKRGRPATAKPSPKKPGRSSHQKAPAKIPSAGVKKRGRPLGSTNAKKSTTALKATKTKAKAKAPPSTATKGGRPTGKHVSNLSTNLKSLISSASKGRLVELLSVLCARNAVVAKATSSALREEEIYREATGDEIVVEVEQGGGHEGDALSKGSGEVNGVGKAKGKGKARANKNKDETIGNTAAAEKDVHTIITVDEERQVHTEQGTEPKSGYEADVEAEIPATATATEAGEWGGISQEKATAETETIAEAVSSMRDSAFAL